MTKERQLFLVVNKLGGMRFQDFDPSRDLHSIAGCQKTSSKQKRKMKDLSRGVL